MNKEISRQIVHLAIANANLHVGIATDDPIEILKAVHFVRQSIYELYQLGIDLDLYERANLDGIEEMARKRVEENRKMYGIGNEIN